MNDPFDQFCKKYQLGNVPRVDDLPEFDAVTRRLVALESELREYLEANDGQ